MADYYTDTSDYLSPTRGYLNQGIGLEQPQTVTHDLVNSPRQYLLSPDTRQQIGQQVNQLGQQVGQQVNQFGQRLQQRYGQDQQSQFGYQGQPTQQVQQSAQAPVQTQVQVSQPRTGTQYKRKSGVFNLDAKEIFKRALKYLFEGLAVAFVALYFTRGKLDIKDSIILGITAAFVFAILDTFAPTVSLGARFGAGFGIGQTMFGLNPAVAIAPIAPII